MKKRILFTYLVLLLIITPNAQTKEFPKLSGPYLGQKLPGMTPEIFAPGILSTKEDEYAFEINKSGDEILFIRKSKIMLASKNSDGSWTDPSIASFSGKYIDDEPCFSPDGNKIYFMSRRPAKASKNNSNLWVVEKNNGKWGEPKIVKLPVLSKPPHAPTISSKNSIYDDGISIIQFKDGKYLEPKSITGLKGMYPFIAPDESYIIYSAGYSANNGADLYISFKRKNGNWSEGKSLGNEINSSRHESNPFLSPDGKYLFFSRGFNIYWVSANVIEELRPEE
ncbi:MAG: hypothetical protein V1720_12370 [bacterium]